MLGLELDNLSYSYIICLTGLPELAVLHQLPRKVKVEVYDHFTLLHRSNSFIEHGQNEFTEPPETPAHLFAVRAFKTAIFGTPAPRTDQGNEPGKAPLTGKVEEAQSEAVNKPEETTDWGEVYRAPSNTLAMLASPTKGILLTPGTGAGRKKTVSFGSLAMRNELELGTVYESNLVEEILDDLTVRQPSRATNNDRGKQESLRRTLFDLRKKPSVLSEQSPQPHPKATSLVIIGAEEPQDEALGGAEGSLDVTVDLTKPRSKSGQHWKREYQRDHEASKKEIRKLIRYSQASKSCAVRKDQESVALDAKLQQAQHKVTEMEAKISNLASKLAEKQTDDQASPSGPLLTELATQTAQALRYRHKVQRYQSAIERQTLGPKAVKQHNGAVGSKQECMEHTADPNELEDLREAARIAESKAVELEKENLALKNLLARVKREMTAYEARHKVREERTIRKDEKMEAQKQTLKKQLRQAREEIRRLQVNKHAHDKHASNEQNRAMTEQQMQQQKDSIMSESVDIWNDQAVFGPATRRDRTNVKPNEEGIGLQGAKSSPNTTSRPPFNIHESTISENQCQNNGKHNAISKLASKTSNDIFPIPEAAVIHHLRALEYDEFHQPSQSTNSATLGAVKPREMGPPPGTSLLVGRVDKGRRSASSFMPSSRASSMGARPPLPPDRFAAAEMRLAERNAERQKSHAVGKENQSP